MVWISQVPHLKYLMRCNAAVPMVEAMVALVLADQVLQHYAQCQLFPEDPILQGASLRKRAPTPMEEADAFSEF
jgi:hypothetical protein